MRKICLTTTASRQARFEVAFSLPSCSPGFCMETPEKHHNIKRHRELLSAKQSARFAGPGHGLRCHRSGGKRPAPKLAYQYRNDTSVSALKPGRRQSPTRMIDAPRVRTRTVRFAAACEPVSLDLSGRPIAAVLCHSQEYTREQHAKSGQQNRRWFRYNRVVDTHVVDRTGECRVEIGK